MVIETSRRQSFSLTAVSTLQWGLHKKSPSELLDAPHKYWVSATMLDGNEIMVDFDMEHDTARSLYRVLLALWGGEKVWSVADFHEMHEQGAYVAADRNEAERDLPE